MNSTLLNDHTIFRAELVHSSVFVADGAIIRGDVEIAGDSSIWFNAVLRGDSDQIRIGKRTNVQDLCLLHCDTGIPCRIGDNVTLGHGAIVHGATVEDDTLIGIRATLLNNVTIGKGSLIAAGAVVPENTTIPPNSVVMGIPGKIVRSTTASDRQRIEKAAQHYVEVAKTYLASS